MGDNLHLMKWNNFLKSMVLPIIELYCYGPKQMGKLSKSIALLTKLYNLLLMKAVIGNMNWIHSCWLQKYSSLYNRWNTVFPSIFRVVRDKLPIVPGTVEFKARWSSKTKPRTERENENLWWCKTKSCNDWVKARGQCFIQTYRYDRQIDKPLGKWFGYCDQGEQANKNCWEEKRWKSICQKHFNS